jgi:hypothetical protein
MPIVLAAISLVANLGAAVPCSAPGSLPKIYLEADPIAALDSVAHVRLCLGGSGAGARVRSLSGRIVVDTAFGRMLDVERTRSPEVIARADPTGAAMLVAAASSDGFASGTLVTVRVRMTRAGTLPKLSVVLTEISDQRGTSVVTRTNVLGLGPQCAGASPAVFEVLPSAASVDPGEVLDLRIAGCGFSADENTVKFGDVTVRNVKSTDDGTHIRVVVPKEIRSSGEVPPMQLGVGAYEVTVNNGRGTSNAKRVTLR